MIARYDGQDLANGGRESLLGLAATYQRSIQIAPILRASVPKIFARQNGFWTIAFSFAREYDQLIDAHEEASKLAEALPLTGDLELEQIGPNAGAQSTIYEDAVFMSCVPAQIGKTVIFSFNFVAP